MRILLTNDDGINAVGLIELSRALHRKGHVLLIAAPSRDQSCVSHGLTLRRPLHADRAAVPGLEDVPSYAIDGTPADCVRLALGNFGFEPDLIVSGINDAPNLGSDAVYSGTISAAIEAFMVSIPAIAVAKDTFTTEHMDDAAAYFADMLPSLMRFFEDDHGMLSVNIPSDHRQNYRGVRVARTELQTYELRYDERMGADGRMEYYVRPGKTTVLSETEYTDERAMREGYVVITPLTYDITDHSRFDKAKKMFDGVEIL